MRAPWVLALVRACAGACRSGAHAQMRVVNAREQAKRDIETECVQKSVYAWKIEKKKERKWEKARERERENERERVRVKERMNKNARTREKERERERVSRKESERARKWGRERENVEELLRWMTFITIKQNKNMDYLHNIINNYYVYYDY